MNMRNIILFTSLTYLTGCYHFQDILLSPEQTTIAFNQRSLDDTHVAAPNGWGVNELIRAAFYFNAELKEMQALSHEAQGRQLSSTENPNPSVGVKPGFNSTTPSNAGISPWILDFAIDLPIETAGKRVARIAQADFQMESANLKIAAKAWDVRYRVRTALLELYASRKNASLLSQRQQYLQTGLEQFNGRLMAGDVAYVDIQNVTMEFELGKNAVAENQRQQQEALSHLAQAIALPIRALTDISFNFADFEAPPTQLPELNARRMALLNRADLLAALADYNAAQMALKEEVAKQYPDLQVGPGYSFDQSEDKWSLGISLNLPIFNRNQGAIKSAEARREACAAVFTQKQELVTAETELAVADYGSFELQRLQSESIEEQAANVMKTTQQMVQLGEIPGVDASLAGLQHNRSQLELLRARLNVLDAMGRLENAMQHPAGTNFSSVKHSRK